MLKYKVIQNEDAEFAKEVSEAIANNDGYCCCALEKCPETECMCQDFQNKLKNDNFEGLCDCGLYRKIFL